MKFDVLLYSGSLYTLKHKGRVLLFACVPDDIITYIHDKTPHSYHAATTEYGYSLHEVK
jgi:hypothetical protein